ncbi:hypothetical protein MKZ38_001182 [Zalerion maritima]|uniref:Uncharacterized protein n=1 Tax=Zalerion maritima TaxID=339359 RepID=A0AAD5WXJ2_9PEZI|nr:hypothetical protein MKZ38_001182 [Zalerion maritima]
MMTNAVGFFRARFPILDKSTSVVGKQTTKNKTSIHDTRRHYFFPIKPREGVSARSLFGYSQTTMTSDQTHARAPHTSQRSPTGDLFPSDYSASFHLKQVPLAGSRAKKKGKPFFVRYLQSTAPGSDPRSPRPAFLIVDFFCGPISPQAYFLPLELLAGIRISPSDETQPKPGYMSRKIN